MKITSEDLELIKNYLIFTGVISKVNDIEIMGKFNEVKPKISVQTIIYFYKYIIYQQKLKNNDELMKEKIIFRIHGTLERYDNLLDEAEKEIQQCDAKIRVFVKNNQKLSKIFF